MAWTTSDIPDLTGKNAVVTGPTIGGIGYFIARGLAAAGARVILAGRSWEKLDDAAAALTEEVPGASLDRVALDLASLQAVRAGAEAIAAATFDGGGPLHLLVNNAGVMATPQARTVDDLDLQMATNHFGPFLLTGLLLEPLAESGEGRIVTMSSMMHRMARKAPLGFPTVQVGRYSPWNVYSQSKLANLLFTYELQRRLEKAGLPVAAYAAHPGLASSQLMANGASRTMIAPIASIGEAAVRAMAQTPEAGAWPALMAATFPDLEPGTYVGPGGGLEGRGAPKPVSSSRLARDREAARALWELSEQTTGVSYP
ncbi:NAD(P)-dependent dehydrogenase (short-subunit alcohol dehydrogenase family) [Nocardioides luteus]|uniref:Short-chain dehydrogenase n=1 Tax=Nocardioides luteus TaxID=1844 RepID=A0ABQ5SY95_9ACTN|nr:oxidoreductase [Nocardioides luteus]MDR7312523.1 NAD(P)-dependent dehydrogenase (short-subunit alcohol dehydrogenase family) [Nocardioides luteus]GGR45739.1 short-chain dehydrogenase [Nocardioides luteus]GLJ68771.1 short-chain dehydrogenase [Nocardioides luteus]